MAQRCASELPLTPLLIHTSSSFTHPTPQVERVKAEAVGAIWVLATNHDANKVVIARDGGIPPIVAILAGGTPHAQEHAAFALTALCTGNVENQRNTTALLVNLLSKGSDAAQFNANRLLWRMVEEAPSSTRQDIAHAGPILDLVELLKNGNDGAKRFALWSFSLCINETNQKILLEHEEGSVFDPLVVSLTSHRPEARQQAAAALSRLAYKNPKIALKIAKQQGIPPLIRIVKGGGGKASGDSEDSVEGQQHAAAALAELASLPRNGSEIVKHGGVDPLVSLLNGGDNLGKQYAAAAISRLATGNKQTPAALAPALAISAISPLVKLVAGDCGEAAQEEAAGALFALADEVGNRVAITDADGIGPLVTLLGSSNSASQGHAKGVLVRLSIEPANRSLIIKKLVEMLEEEGSSAQEQAAAALAKLASDSAENRISIVDAGGIEPLLSIIGQEKNSKAKEAF